MQPPEPGIGAAGAATIRGGWVAGRVSMERPRALPLSPFTLSHRCHDLAAPDDVRTDRARDGPGVRGQVRDASGARRRVLKSRRATLWVCCQKFLVRSLYHDLRGIATEHGTAHASAESLELGALPAPVSAGAGGGGGGGAQKTAPVALARLAFALCFGESCVMFLLLMAQAADVLSPACVPCGGAGGCVR
jgi:hypothetical protein